MGVETAIAVGVGALAGAASSGMMGGKQSTPKVVQQDPEADARAAKTKADEAAGKAAAQAKKNRKASSLLSTGGESGLDAGKNTLGA